tara:strand:- start:259 stop:702 length:444 start_codon:yes stop_codon:yes gene_type:complete
MKREIAPEDIDLVFSFHKKHHPREKLNADKRKLIRQRLKDGYSILDLRTAIIGIHNTPHNLGDNDRRTKYLGLHVSLKHQNIDRFIEAGEQVLKRREIAKWKKARKQKSVVASRPVQNEKAQPSPEQRAKEIADFRDMLKKEITKED